MREREPVKRFEYRKRDAADVEARANQKGGSFDKMFKETVAFFSPKVQKDPYCVRFLPPTWEGAKHYGLEIWVHSKVGPDDQRYLCLEQNVGCEKNTGCPVCEESRRLKVDKHDPETSGKLAYALKAKKHVATWIIDRDDEKAGPLLWKFVWMDDRDITGLSINRRTGEVMYLDEPDTGFDLEFSVVQQGEYTNLSGIRIAQRSTPLSDDQRLADQWLQFVQENPIPDCLNFYPAAHILKVLNGGKVIDENGSDEPEGRQARRQADEAPRRESLRDSELEGLDAIDEPAGYADEPPRRGRNDDPPPRRSREPVEEPRHSREAAPPPRRAVAAEEYPDEPPRNAGRRPLR